MAGQKSAASSSRQAGPASSTRNSTAASQRNQQAIAGDQISIEGPYAQPLPPPPVVSVAYAPRRGSKRLRNLDVAASSSNVADSDPTRAQGNQATSLSTLDSSSRVSKSQKTTSGTASWKGKESAIACKKLVSEDASGAVAGKQSVHHGEISSAPTTVCYNERKPECTICLCVPMREIYQCVHGHLMCDDCHKRIVLCGDANKCPTCKEIMSSDRPIRCAFAEAARDEIRTKCKYKSCGKILGFAKIRAHELECVHRPATCGYALIGCTWEGEYWQVKGHESKCKWPTKTGSKVLKAVTAMEAKKSEARDIEKQRLKQVEAALDVFSMRCRNIEVKDVRLKHDEYQNGRICSERPLRLQSVSIGFVINLRHRSNGEQIAFLSFEPNITSARYQNLEKAVFRILVMKGPTLQIDLSPTVRDLDFKGRNHCNRRGFFLNCDPETSRRLVDHSEIQLRIAFVDLSHGVSRKFSTHRDMSNNGGGSGGNQDDDYNDHNEDDVSDGDHEWENGSENEMLRLFQSFEDEYEADSYDYDDDYLSEEDGFSSDGEY